MSTVTKILTGAAGLAAMVGLATPASAQYYPGNGSNNGGGVLGTILNGVLGGGGGQYGSQYGGYGNNSEAAVNQCAGAVNARLRGQRYGGYQGGYGGNWNGNSSYGYNNNSGRVSQIVRVERRSNGGLKVYGLAQSAAASQGGQYGGYNNGYGGGYNNGYGGGYGNGYGGGYGNNGYGNNGGYADIKFNCKLDAYGRITDVDIDRNNSGGYNNGYNNGYRGY